jgi:uncharacterized membrane protein
MTRSSRAGWPAAAGLVALSAVPVLAGALRLGELTGGAEASAENARFLAAPLPVVVHIVAATVFSVLGAFQFVPGFRARRPRWHRLAGRVLVVCGLATGLSGLWMALFYPHPPGDGPLLTAFRLVFGSAMVVSIALGLLAVLRRDILRHRAWMLRGYALAMAAGTQALTTAVWIVLVGPPDELGRALAVGAGWVVNLAVAEWLVRRPRRAGRGRVRTAPAGLAAG